MLCETGLAKKTNSLIFTDSSVGRKIFMGISGLSLVTFLIIHFLGNLFLLKGPDAFNRYAHFLRENPAFPVLEILLTLLFATHIGMASYITWINARARGDQGYMMKRYSGRGTATYTFASSTMPYTGFLILVFIVLHIFHFRNGTYYETMIDGQSSRDLYRTVFEFFISPWNVVLYLVSFLLLSTHLMHGFQSAFQTLSLKKPRYANVIKKASVLFALFVFFGFSIFPIILHFQLGRG